MCLVDDESPVVKLAFPRKKLHVAILRTNKQVYKEAVFFLYSENRFHLPTPLLRHIYSGPPRFTQFLSQVGTRADLIRHVTIDLPREPERVKDALQSLTESFRNLTTLELCFTACDETDITSGFTASGS